MINQAKIMQNNVFIMNGHYQFHLFLIYNQYLWEVFASIYNYFALFATQSFTNSTSKKYGKALIFKYSSVMKISTLCVDFKGTSSETFKGV